MPKPTPNWRHASRSDIETAIKLGWQLGPDVPGESDFDAKDLTLRWYKDGSPVYPVHSHLTRPVRAGFHPSRNIRDADEIFRFLRHRAGHKPFIIVFEPLQDGPLKNFEWECFIKEPERIKNPVTYSHSFGGSPADSLTNAFVKLDLKTFSNVSEA